MKRIRTEFVNTKRKKWICHCSNFALIEENLKTTELKIEQFNTI